MDVVGHRLWVVRLQGTGGAQQRDGQAGESDSGREHVHAVRTCRAVLRTPPQVVPGYLPKREVYTCGGAASTAVPLLMPFGPAAGQTEHHFQLPTWKPLLQS